jgi:hypothetical protein
MSTNSGLDDYEIQLLQERNGVNGNNCTSCGSHRIANLYGKTSDLSELDVDHLDIHHDGYPIDIEGICGGDDIQFVFCLDCGQIQHFVSPTDEELLSLVIVED